MVADPQTITGDQPLAHALHMMVEGGFRHVPVVDDKGTRSAWFPRAMPLARKSSIWNRHPPAGRYRRFYRLLTRLQPAQARQCRGELAGHWRFYLHALAA